MFRTVGSELGGFTGGMDVAITLKFNNWFGQSDFRAIKAIQGGQQPYLIVESADSGKKLSIGGGTEVISFVFSENLEVCPEP